VVVGLRHRNGRPFYDKTLQTVLGERPCRVIVVSEFSNEQKSLIKSQDRGIVTST
jgi:hypothetical protein